MATMCSLSKKYLDNDKEKYIEYLDNPKFMCKNCGRLANSDKNLCRPVLVEEYLTKDSEKNSKKVNKLKKKIKKLKKKLKKL